MTSGKVVLNPGIDAGREAEHHSGEGYIAQAATSIKEILEEPLEERDSIGHCSRKQKGLPRELGSITSKDGLFRGSFKDQVPKSP